ncbi:MAG: sulfur carrier protein ThiS [Actinobacteria bacterium]|nr:sulfur carrier protein ThiS [Actinomycetota bacterium]
MNVIVNGDQTELDSGATLADVVMMMGRQRMGSGVAAALNGELVTRSEWQDRRVTEGDRIEILGAAQGG